MKDLKSHAARQGDTADEQMPTKDRRPRTAEDFSETFLFPHPPDDRRFKTTQPRTHILVARLRQPTVPSLSLPHPASVEDLTAGFEVHSSHITPSRFWQSFYSQTTDHSRIGIPRLPSILPITAEVYGELSCNVGKLTVLENQKRNRLDCKPRAVSLQCRRRHLPAGKFRGGSRCWYAQKTKKELRLLSTAITVLEIEVARSETRAARRDALFQDLPTQTLRREYKIIAKAEGTFARLVASHIQMLKSFV
jgi:hypothetical protein